MTQPNLWPPADADRPEPPVLRPYQVEALNAIEEKRAAGIKRVLVALPTGTGKTVVFTGSLPSLRQGRRALIVAHREELLDQAAGAIRLAYPEWSVGVEQADRAAPRGADVVVASIQTLTVWGARRLHDLRPAEFGVIVIDEAHHSTARSYVEMLAWFGLCPPPTTIMNDDWDDLDKKQRASAMREGFKQFLPSSDAPLLLGVTATPNRGDGEGLEFVFDEIAYSRTIREMIEEGWLAPVRGFRVETGANLDKVTTRGGDFAEGALAAAIDTEERNAVAVRAWLDHAPGRQTLAFTSTVEHARNLEEAFIAAGVKAAHVSGETPSNERHAIIAGYKAGRIQVVCNCAVLTEGFDAPATSCILMARPTKSPTLYTQMLGRGTRTAPGKNDLVVIDLVDGYSRAGIANLNTLFGLPPKFDDDGADVVSLVAQLELELGAVARNLLENVTTFEEARRVAQSIDPLAAAELDPMIRQVARLQWVPAPWGYGLNLPQCSVGVVVDLLGQATVRVKYPNEFPQTVGHYSDPATAIEAAELWVTGNKPEVVAMASKGARWHKNEPTPAQLEYAEKLHIKVPAGANRGQVSALISVAKAKRGAGMWQRGMKP